MRLRGWALVCLLVAVGWAGRAQAQALDPTVRFETQRFKPAAAPNNYITTEGGHTLGHLNFSAALMLDYAYHPLVVGGVDVIGHSFGMNLMLAFGLWDRLEIAAALPLAIVQSGNDPLTPVSGGVGDLRVVLKVRALTAKFFTLSFGLPIEAPTGSQSNFLGGNGWGLTPKAIFSFDWSRFGFAINGGYRVALLGRRFDLMNGQVLVMDDEFQAGVGAKVVAVKNLMDVIVDSQVAIGIREHDPEERFAELWGALRFHLPHGLSVDVGGGPGLSRGPGTPSGRVFAGLAYWYANRDRDKDGIQDDVDKCPDDPEDRDNFEDADGCPDPDNDKDGILDAQDKCPNDPEDKDGFEDEDGCPDPDNDKDGIADAQDKCPNDPEDKDGFEDADGCPDPDNDKDGIPDVKDKCPNDPETMNGFEDEDGCPDTLPPEVKKFSGTVSGITFEFAKSDIRPDSFPTLDAAAAVFKEYPDLKVLIRGHTDNVGAEARNKMLSTDRAEAVKAYLVSKGIAADRITTEGLGYSEPIATQKTAEGRAKNRRIEFRLVTP